MASDKSAELDLEARLKDQILSHARAVYGSAYPSAGAFDVVFEKETKALPNGAYSLVAYRPHLIVYEWPTSHANWTLILSVQLRQTITEGMGVLLEILREKMTALLVDKQMPETERERYSQMYDPFRERPQYMIDGAMGTSKMRNMNGAAMDFASSDTSMSSLK